MIIGTKRLLELVNDPTVNLVEGLCERELTNPEGECFDFRVGAMYDYADTSPKGFLGIEKRDTPDVEFIAKYDFDLDKQQVVSLNPREYVLVETIEKVNLPEKISLRFTPRTTLQRNGILLITSNASPGNSGGLTFGMYNLGNVQFKLEMGARVVHAIFHKIDGSSSLYKGQWQGGRITTDGKEKQI